MKPVFLFDHPIFRQHDNGPGHPERPERLDAAVRGIRRQGLEDALEWVTPAPAAEQHLLRVHTAAHVQMILGLRGKHAEIDADTQVSPASVEAALTASGACIEGVDRVLENPKSAAFCLCRPPGHHAESDQAMGFCLFNHVAVAAAYAIAEKGIGRVLIVDPDVHHGNGTQEIFYRRADVAYASVHQWPLFPGTGQASEQGAGEGRGSTVNVPLPAGAGDADYLAVSERVILPLVRSFQPELVIFSAGFDAHADDPLGGMQVTCAGFVDFYAPILQELTKGEIPVVFSLEGGYSLAALEETVPAILNTVRSIG